MNDQTMKEILPKLIARMLCRAVYRHAKRRLMNKKVCVTRSGRRTIGISDGRDSVTVRFKVYGDEICLSHWDLNGQSSKFWSLHGEVPLEELVDWCVRGWR